MAGFFQQFLRGAVDGFLGSPNFKDYKHANKTFTANAYQNAPKFKWLFHVYFDINSTLISDNPKVFPSEVNHGLLVKSVDLPSYRMQVEELNQYNRKRLVQTKINYDPIKIVFHDDNANQIRNLWYTYYSYHYYDPSQPFKPGTTTQDRTTPGKDIAIINNRNIYEDVVLDNQKNWGYVGEPSGATKQGWQPNKKVPFFRAIRIYGFNQHNFALYEVINPVIESFSHDSYAYSSSETMECNMSIRYETVKYYEGALNGQNPGGIVEGFADPSIYDTDLSPISKPGTNRSILGRGGLVDSADGILEDLKSGNVLGALQTAGRLGKTFKNREAIYKAAKAELLRGAINAVSSPSAVRSLVEFPAQGAGSGTASQTTGSSSSDYSSRPALVSVPGNTPINPIDSKLPGGGI
jgi:hypothetical protein